MKRLLICVCAVAVALVALCGCGAKTLDYDLNAGYDFNGVKCQELVFTVYKTNDDCSWEKIKTMKVTPKADHYYDVKLGDSFEFSAKSQIELRESTITKTTDSISYGSALKDLVIYEFPKNKARGVLSTNGKVKDIDGEQVMHLYVYSDSESGECSTQDGVDPSEPFDAGADNAGNILVTVTIVK